SYLLTLNLFYSHKINSRLHDMKDQLRNRLITQALLLLFSLLINHQLLIGWTNRIDDRGDGVRKYPGINIKEF
ncbi:MAG: hypothetical protein ACC633_06105, partial [Anaerolineales bacterium]